MKEEKYGCRVNKNNISGLEDDEYKSIEERIGHAYQDVKYIAVNKDIDENKYRLACLGEFGNTLVKDIYGNMNFQKDKAI